MIRPRTAAIRPTPPRRLPDAARLRLQRQADRDGLGCGAVADAWAGLMTALGYDRFGAQGGDWGSAVTPCIGVQHPDRCVGIHLNMVIAPARARTR